MGSGSRGVLHYLGQQPVKATFFDRRRRREAVAQTLTFLNLSGAVDTEELRGHGFEVLEKLDESPLLSAAGFSLSNPPATLLLEALTSFVIKVLTWRARRKLWREV